jgi:hypothetical protein
LHVLKNILKFASKGNCEIIIGNFSTINPSKNYMELFEWNLHHRSPQKLIYLAESCGLNSDQISVSTEEEGVNLFLHIKI